MMTPMASRAALALRMEDSSFRQVERITNLLTKLKARPAQGMDQTFAPRTQRPTANIDRHEEAPNHPGVPKMEGYPTKLLKTKGSGKQSGGISNYLIENTRLDCLCAAYAPQSQPSRLENSPPEHHVKS